MTRLKAVLVGVAIFMLGAGTAVLFAQGEPLRLMRQLEVHRGDLILGTSVDIIMEGATVDEFDTTITVTDPTADRTITHQNATYTVVGRDTTDTLTNKTLTTPAFTQNVTAAGGTETLTAADCGSTTLLDTATGSVVTLPAATGSGCVFHFVVTVTNSSNDHSIIVVGNDEFVGGLTSAGTTADQTDVFTAADTGDVDAIQMNGTTEGGILGTAIWVMDISADNWALWGLVHSTDASATMLATGQAS